VTKGSTPGRSCSICTHPERDRIDAALIDPHRRFLRVARRFGLTEMSVRRHVGNHLAADLVAADDLAELTRRESIAQRVLDLLAEAEDRIAQHRDDATSADHLRAVREARAILLDVAKLVGLVQATAEVNVNVGGARIVDATEVAAVILGALAPWPDARAAMGRALAGLAWPAA
jgi:hypothetical protein